MDKLNEELLKSMPQWMSRVGTLALPEKVLQFGEGNFLRGFVDWMIDELNQQGLFAGRIVAVQPTPHGKVVPKLNAQDGIYTVATRGLQDGQVVDDRTIVTSVSRGINPYTDWNAVLEVAADPEIRVVVSNTTESGLKYLAENFVANQSPASFPGKLTAALYHRYRVYQGDPSRGWLIVPCELVSDNGVLLKDLVLRLAREWGFPEDFCYWVEHHNRFYTTLVDRIITGFPKDSEVFAEQLGYEDELLTVGEPYHLFVLDGDPVIQDSLPFDKVGLNVRWADVVPYRELKVRILNGSHTLMCAVGLLSGQKTVQDVMANPVLSHFVDRAMYDEILPMLDVDGAEEFAQSVKDRFRNPFNPHKLLDISLNSTAKFKERLLPTLVQYVERFQKVPPLITCSLAALIRFYKGAYWENGQLFGQLIDEAYPIRDGEEVVQFFDLTWQQGQDGEHVVERVLANEALWGMNLSVIPGLQAEVVRCLKQFELHLGSVQWLG